MLNNSFTQDQLPLSEKLWEMLTSTLSAYDLRNQALQTPVDEALWVTDQCSFPFSCLAAFFPPPAPEPFLHA